MNENEVSSIVFRGMMESARKRLMTSIRLFADSSERMFFQLTHLLSSIEQREEDEGEEEGDEGEDLTLLCFFDPKNSNRVFQIIITSHLEEGLERRRRGGGNRVVFIPLRVPSVLKVF